MSLRITTLIENSQGKNLDLQIEHGISFLMEKDNIRLLFDTGKSGAFINNAQKMNIDLSNLDLVVLSHGHYDHSGGFMSLTKESTEFDLFMGQGFFNKKYGFKNNEYYFLGNNFSEKDLLNKKIKYHFVNKRKTEIAKGVYVITNFIKKNDDEIVNSRFKLIKDGSYIVDPFDDEILLAVDTPKGIVVLIGCSHPGIKNMLDTVLEEFDKPVYAVLGGTHLVEAKDESLEKSIKYLGNKNFKILGVSHCTGEKAMKSLDAYKSFYHNNTGSVFEIDF